MYKLDYDSLLEMLRDAQNFSFSRWGDGEWNCVFGVEGENCDGMEYDKEMGLSLAAVLMQTQRYYFGMQPKAVKDMGRDIDAWCKENAVDIKWCNADMIHDASIAGRLGEMIEAMAGRKVIMVANERLHPVAERLKCHRVDVPLRHAWRYYRQIYGDLMDQVDKDCVVLYSMGMATNVMIHQVYSEFGDRLTQIDAGSVWEPYCNIVSRRYHKNIIGRAL